jgi:hypothetical protein
MLAKLKNLFRGKKPVLHNNFPPLVLRNPVAPPRRSSERPNYEVNTSPTTVSAASVRDDFATSFAVGMATNNALLGGAVGGSYIGGMMGDLARDGVIGEAAKSHSRCESSSSWSDSSSVSYDGGSSSSSCSSD